MIRLVNTVNDNVFAELKWSYREVGKLWFECDCGCGCTIKSGGYLDSPKKCDLLFDTLLEAKEWAEKAGFWTIEGCEITEQVSEEDWDDHDQSN